MVDVACCGDASSDVFDDVVGRVCAGRKRCAGWWACGHAVHTEDSPVVAVQVPGEQVPEGPPTYETLRFHMSCLFVVIGFGVSESDPLVAADCKGDNAERLEIQGR